MRLLSSSEQPPKLNQQSPLPKSLPLANIF
jgi:hypothetical protein